jgi:hypothetical protein
MGDEAKNAWATSRQLAAMRQDGKSDAWYVCTLDLHLKEKQCLLDADDPCFHVRHAIPRHV